MSQRQFTKTDTGVLGLLASPQGKAMLMLAFLVLTAGCMGVLDDDDAAAPGTEPLDTVPEGVDGVAFFSGEIVQDQATEELMDGALDRAQQFDPEYDGPENWEAALAEFEDESDVRVGGFNSALMFFQEDDADLDDDYVGVIVQSTWSSDELEAAFEEEPETDTYNGVTIWIEEDQITEEETWAADLGDGAYVFGNPAAVQDAVDTFQGDAPAFSGELRAAYESADDGLMKMAVDIPEEEVDDVAFEMNVMTMTYFTQGSQMNMQAQFTMGSEEDAENAAGAANFALNEFQNQAEMEGEDELVDMIERLEIQTDGNQLRATFTTNPDEILELFDEFMMGMGPGTQFSVQPQVGA